MNRETIARLDGINRAFYAKHAEEFLATRAAPWPGWRRVLPHLEDLPPVSTAPRILDLGCGNGRLGGWLEQYLLRPHAYVGLDRSLPLLSQARHLFVGGRSPARLQVDLVAAAGGIPCRDGAFDAVLALALLHHLPSFDLRRALIADALRAVRPGGMLALSFWQFAEEERFARRSLSWDELDRDRATPVDPAELEDGDRLLLWGERGKEAPAVRYCHHASLEEVTRLMTGLPADPLETFRADGRSGRLNLYVMVRRR